MAQRLDVRMRVLVEVLSQHGLSDAEIGERPGDVLVRGCVCVYGFGGDMLGRGG